LIVLLLLGILVLILFIVVGIYNNLIALRNRIDNAWHQIDVQLKRRADLIPNLIETVKGYAAHEKETFSTVTEARTKMMQAGSIKEQAQAQNELTGALKSLFAVAEAYPELKANQNFLMLQEELAGTENKIGFARQFYNDTVMQYNQAIQQFPGNIFAGMYNFTAKEYFEIEETAREAPKVKF
jgi:LemA protein